MMVPSTSSRFSTVLAVETYKLKRSMALWLAMICPALIAGFVFFHQLRLGKAASWDMMLTSSAALWSFFMLPMSVTALTALMAHTEHGPRAWDHLRSLPRPRWHVYLAKAICVLGLIVAMSAVLAALTSLAVLGAGWWKPAVAAIDSPDYARYLGLLGRIFASSWLLVAVQLWVALNFSSFVPALSLGIGGTFFSVVATSATVGLAMPWQIPVNQLAADPARAQLALVIGFAGGVVVLAMMLFALSRREVIS